MEQQSLKQKENPVLSLNEEQYSGWDSTNEAIKLDSPLKVEAIDPVIKDEFISNGNENPVNGANKMTIDEYSYGSMVDLLDMSEHPLVIDESPLSNQCQTPVTERQETGNVLAEPVIQGEDLEFPGSDQFAGGYSAFGEQDHALLVENPRNEYRNTGADEFISNGNENPMKGADILMTIDEYTYGSIVDPLDMSEHPLVIDESPLSNQCQTPVTERQETGNVLAELVIQEEDLEFPGSDQLAGGVSAFGEQDHALSVENPRNEYGNPGPEELIKAGLSDIVIRYKGYFQNQKIRWCGDWCFRVLTKLFFIKFCSIKKQVGVF